MRSPSAYGHIPLRPTSVNSLYVNRNGRKKTEKYKTWLAQVGLHMNGYRTISGPVRVEYVIKRHADKRKRDLGNYEKAMSDLLVRHGIIDDDSEIQEIVLRWARDEIPEDMEVSWFVWSAERFYDG